VIVPGRFARRAAALALAAATACAALPAPGADFRATAEAPTILYDAPSARARPQFVFGRDVPLEVLVVVDGWTKVRDLGGTIGWIPSKSLADKRVLQVRVAAADVRASADDASPIVFRAEQNVLLELAEPATSAGTTAQPRWVKVRHPDGATGYARITQLYGL
jgi:SH3-like domain-containing protein